MSEKTGPLWIFSLNIFWRVYNWIFFLIWWKMSYWEVHNATQKINQWMQNRAVMKGEIREMLQWKWDHINRNFNNNLWVSETEFTHFFFSSPFFLLLFCFCRWTNNILLWLCLPVWISFQAYLTESDMDLVRKSFSLMCPLHLLFWEEFLYNLWIYTLKKNLKYWILSVHFWFY